jgi:hypothetical protein
MRRVVGLAAVACLAGSAHAEKVYFGQGGDLIDFDVDPGVVQFQITVPDAGEIVSFKSVTLFDFNHTYAGDLVITLTHETSGLSVTLLDRPGVPESTFGDSADFVGDYTWVDGGYFYDLDDFDVTVDEHVLAPVVGVLSTFDGIDKSGVWTLEIGDYAADDTGTLGSWNIVMNNIPAPGALALLGLAGLTGLTERRRRV